MRELSRSPFRPASAAVTRLWSLAIGAGLLVAGVACAAQAEVQGTGGKGVGNYLFAIGAIVLLVIILLRRQIRVGGLQARPRTPGVPESLARPSSQPLRGEAERLLVDLQDFGREIEGRLETRILHLTRLTAEADRAIERLTALLAVAGDRLAADRPIAERPAVERPIAERPIAETAKRERDPARAQIVEMAAQGKPVAEIARALNLPMGEVELVLGIERKLQAGLE